jgi:predicted acyltransferase (DUF342 family)
MKKLALAAILGSSFCLGVFADDISGYVSDAHCGAKHNTVSEANTKCIKGCLKAGDPVLVSEGKVLKFDADSKEKAVAHAGENVKIDGTVTGDTVKINSIDSAK